MAEIKDSDTSTTKKKTDLPTNGSSSASASKPAPSAPITPGLRTAEMYAASTSANMPHGVTARDYSNLTPDSPWPPPVFIDPNASPRELYYIEHRWHAQWAYYDKKAAASKAWYQRLQMIITVGSAAVPVLVGIQAADDRLNFALYVATICISFMVAAASAIETVKKYGENWRSYRTAAEELLREKSLYDVGSGPYRRSVNPFLLFVERCEEIVAKQNGAWSSLKEEQIQHLDQQGQGHLEGSSGGSTVSVDSFSQTTGVSDAG